MTIAQGLERRRVDELEPHPKNSEVYGGDDELTPDFLDSIAEHGIREPLVVTPEGCIISGHRRWRAAKELDRSRVPVRVQSFDSELEEWQALLDYNRQRRKTPAQLINEAELLMEIEKNRAEERQGSRNDLQQSEEPPGKSSKKYSSARDKVGEQLGASGRTIEKGLRVKERAEDGDEEAEEEWEKLQNDEQSIHGAYESVRESRDPDTDDVSDDDLGPTTRECSVCGDTWTEWDLSDREGESVEVDHVCVVSHPDEFVFHFPEGEP